MGEPLSDNWKPPQLNLTTEPKPKLALAPEDSVPQGIVPVRRDWELKQAAWPKEQLIKWGSFDDAMVSILWPFAVVFLISGIVSAVMAIKEMNLFFGLSCVLGFVGLFGFANGGRPFKFRVRSGKERARLRAVRSWLKLHRREIKALRAKVSAFNEAIGAFNELQERCADAIDEPIRIAAHEALEKQRQVLQTEVNSRIAELEGVEATAQMLLPEAEAAVKAEAKAARRAAKEAQRRAREDECRELEAARCAFRKRVKVWQKLDRGLARGADNGRYDATQDISPYVAAMQMRAKLADECLELGLSPSELPEPTSALRLPAKTGG